MTNAPSESNFIHNRNKPSLIMQTVPKIQNETNEIHKLNDNKTSMKILELSQYANGKFK